MKTLFKIILAVSALAVAVPAYSASKKSGVNPFETGFIPGSTANRATKPGLLGPKGVGQATRSQFNAKTARIAFTRIKGGKDFHQALINKLAPEMVKGNRVKVVGIDQKPTHIITGRILSFLTSSGAIVSYRWHVRNAEGQKLQYFVDTERGNKVRFTGWDGISRIEMRKVSKTAADRLVFWLNNGAS